MKANIKNKIQELFVEQSGAVLNAFPSIFSKSDVDSLIVKIHKAVDDIIDNEFSNGVVDDSPSPRYTWEEIAKVIEDSDLKSHAYTDNDTASFNIRYSNELELEDVECDFNTSDYLYELKDKFNAFNENRNRETTNA